MPTIQELQQNATAARAAYDQKVAELKAAYPDPNLAPQSAVNEMIAVKRVWQQSQKEADQAQYTADKTAAAESGAPVEYAGRDPVTGAYTYSQNGFKYTSGDSPTNTQLTKSGLNENSFVGQGQTPTTAAESVSSINGPARTDTLVNESTTTEGVRESGPDNRSLNELVSEQVTPADSADYYTTDVNEEGDLIQREKTLDEILADNPLEDDPYAQQADNQVNGTEFVSQLTGGGNEGGRAVALRQEAQRQQAIRDQQQQQASAGDWRVKLRLAPGANYLYRANDGKGSQAGIMQPLAVTDGVVFPYTPKITTAYHAQYNTYDLTHSNYRGAFYQSSYTGDITIEAVFTAQDTAEANYLLAVIHFFRSATKMFYGQDAQRGAPPPLVYLQGLGQFQFNLHPCVIREFTYALPDDVDYIRAQVTDHMGTNMLKSRDRQTLPTNIFAGAVNRLSQVGLWPGAETRAKTTQTSTTVPTLGTKDPTYVPTKMSMSITLLPMQSREQVSKQFSLRDFTDGTLVKKGFW